MHAAMVGQGANIAPSAYFFRADRMPEEIPAEMVFLFEAALKHSRPTPAQPPVWAAKGLSQNPSLLQSGIGELQMDKGQVVADLLFPAYKETPRAVRPGVTSFDYPAAGALSGAMLWLDFAPTRDVRDK